MLNVNTAAVRGKIAEKGLTLSSTAERLDLNRNTLASYLQDPERMTIGVAKRLETMLCDNEADSRRLFFGDTLRNTQDSSAADTPQTREEGEKQ